MSSKKRRTTLGPRIREDDTWHLRRDDASHLHRDDACWLPSFPRMRESSVVGICAFALLFATSPVRGQDWVLLEKSEGAALFGEKCGMCHRETGMGTGILARRMTPELALLENRTDLQTQFIETAVRAGLGVMFPMSRAEVSDAQLETLISYLTSERNTAASRATGEKKVQ